MKKTLKISIMILLSFVWQHCTEDQAPAKPGNGNVQFALRAKASSLGRAAADVGDAYAVFVSIRNAAGETVYTRKEIRLLTLAGDFISEPLLLPAGDYELTEFLVTNSNQTVIFAAPLEGSSLASLVQDPLPLSFTVGQNVITDLDIEVLDAEAQTPTAFGYVTFGFTEVPYPVFQLAVFKPAGGALALSGAHVYLVEDNDTVFYDYLPAQLNTISFVPHENAQYRLMLYEDGYKRYDRYLSLDELTEEPWEVVLEPALTFVLNNPSTFYEMIINLYFVEGSEGESYWVDWGDGRSFGYYTVQQINNQVQLSFRYIDNKPHFMSISGNLNLIRGLAFERAPGGVGAVSVQHLPALRDFSLSGFPSPPTIDFSHNPKLEGINMAYASLTSLDVSENSMLNYIVLYANPGFTTESIDAFIAGLLQNVANREGPYVSGYLSISDGTGEGMEPIGPPSEAARANLRTLFYDYGWEVQPQFFFE